MHSVEHVVEIHGRAASGKKIQPTAAGFVLERIPDLVRDSIRMGVLRSSRPKGRPLSSLAPTWDLIRFVGQSSGRDDSTRLHFTAPRLQDAAAPLFDQQQLFDDVVAPDETGFDLLGRLILDVSEQRQDSERFDSAVLARLIGLNKMSSRGIDSLRLAGHKLDELRQTDIDAAVIESARALYSDTPVSNRVRVTGHLDMIRVSNRLFELVLPDHRHVRAVWTARDFVHLKDFLSKEVVIEGAAVYRPSGTLLRVDADAIRLSTERDAFFSTVPTPPTARLDWKSLRQVQTGQSGINAIWGTWDGDESDEDLLAALEEIR